MIYTEAECIKRYEEDIKNPLINTRLKKANQNYFLDTPKEWVYNPEYINYFSCRVLNQDNPEALRDLTQYHYSLIYSLYNWGKLFKLLYADDYVGGIHNPTIKEFYRWTLDMVVTEDMIYSGSFEDNLKNYTYEQVELIFNNLYSIDGASYELSHSQEEITSLLMELPLEARIVLSQFKSKMKH